jgi:hypothetical protein
MSNKTVSLQCIEASLCFDAEIEIDELGAHRCFHCGGLIGGMAAHDEANVATLELFRREDGNG